MKHRARLLASLSAVLLAPPAFAQVAEPGSDPQAQPAAQEETDDLGLKDIIVTATRRSVDLQRVAATVEAVPAATLEAFNVNSVAELPNLVSGLVVSPSGGNNLFLRGVGSSSQGFNESQVAVYVDGLYLANPAMGLYSFTNIDQVEVLKGPQGTLYGRNVTGGLVSITTRAPSDKASVDVSFGYANYETVSTNLYATGPITDTLSASVAVFREKQNRGWGINIFNGNDVQKSEEFGVQLKLLWKPGPNTRVTASFIYDENERDIGYAYQVYPGTLGTDGTPFLGKYRIASRIDSEAPFRAYVGSLKIEQDLGFASLMSMTGYQSGKQTPYFQGGAPILGQPVAGQGVTYSIFPERNRTFSQEFQLTSAPSDSRLDWVAGAFYYHDNTRLELNNFNTCVGTVCAPGFTPTSNIGYPTIRSYSGYGDATYRFFDATRVTVGLRYTDETRGLTGIQTPFPGRPNSVAALPVCTVAPANCPAGTVTQPGQPFQGFPDGIPTRLHFGQVTYRGVVAQDFGENIHAYASANLGFKSGAFNANLFTNPPARPELLHAYEAGLKTELFDRRVRLNLAYFLYDYKDVQVRSAAPPAIQGFPVLQNAAKERMSGIDADFSIAVARGLVVNGSFEILDAKYVDYPGATCSTPGTRVVNGVTVGVATTVPCNLAGRRPQYSPPFSGSLSAVYTLATSSGTFRFSGNDHYTSAHPLVPDGTIRQDKLHIFDASINWMDSSEHLELNLFAKNITNQYMYIGAQVTTNYTVVPGAPRTYGARLGFHF